MSITKYRPWGLLPWVLPKIQARAWDFLGCISTEGRSLAGLQELVSSSHTILSTSIWNVSDPPSRFAGVIAERIRENQNLYSSLFSAAQVKEHRLFENNQIIVDGVNAFVNSSSGSVILDISTFPKRFFFPIVKLLMKSSAINDLVVLYTIPREYFSGHIAEDPGPWTNLPLFGSETQNRAYRKNFIVGTGFLSLGLPEQLKSDLTNKDTFMLLFPFPSSSHSYDRNWDIVRQLETELSVSPELIYMSSRDVASAFDHIDARISNDEEVFLAPYGPKPISLAMCIYATLSGAGVYYTQPSVYHPDYSKGVSMIDGQLECYAYCLRLDGHDMFKLKSRS